MSLKSQQALKFLKDVLSVTPHNTSRVYVQLDLVQSNCKLYVPVAHKNVEKAKSIKDYMQTLCNEAGL